MTTLRSKVASALSFAHLTGFAKAGASEDDEKDPKKESAEGDDPEKKDDDKKESKKAEDDKDKESADDDAPDKKDDDDKDKAKGKAKSEDDDDKDKKPGAEDDDDDEEMSGNSTAAAARRRERARCAAIFASKAAGRNPQLAANLAFNTRMTRQEALTVLESTPAAAASVGDRSARNPDLGSGGEMANGKQSATDRMVDKMRAAQGK